MARVLELILPNAKAEYFSTEGWTGIFDLPVGQSARGGIIATS
jgi:hypothetical protein